MNLKDLTNLQFIKSLFTFSNRITQKYTDEDIRKNIGLYLSKAGYYGIYDPLTKETSPLEINQTDFTSTTTVNILIEGYINLSKTPSVTGGGSISYNGYGILEINGIKVYDGRGGSGISFSTPLVGLDTTISTPITETDNTLSALGKLQGQTIKTITSVKSGDGITQVFNIPHGLTGSPTYKTAHANSLDALGSFYTDADPTNIIITYSVAPPSGTNNLKFSANVKL